MSAKKVVTLDVVKRLLDRVGANYSEDITLERATKKLERYVKKDGIPEEYLPDEAQALIALNLAEMAPEPTAKPAKDKPTAKPKKAKPPKAPKDKAPKEPKGERADWMAAAGKALTKFKSIDKAAEEALKTYLANGGRKVANVKANARMSVSRAVRALAAFGVLELSEDGSKITTK